MRSNRGDGTSEFSESWLRLGPTADLLALRASRFCWLPTSLDLLNWHRPVWVILLRGSHGNGGRLCSLSWALFPHPRRL